jgi:hypothetical protein
MRLRLLRLLLRAVLVMLLRVEELRLHLQIQQRVGRALVHLGQTGDHVQQVVIDLLLHLAPLQANHASIRVHLDVGRHMRGSSFGRAVGRIVELEVGEVEQMVEIVLAGDHW